MCKWIFELFGNWRTARNIFAALSLLCFLLSGCLVFAEPQRIVKVGYFDQYNLIEKRPDGKYVGYACDYLNEVSRYTGWKYEYRYDSIENNLRLLKEGKIDLLCGMPRETRWENDFAFSNLPIGIAYSWLYVARGNDRIFYDDYKGFSGLRVGFLSGGNLKQTFDAYAQKNNFDYQTMYFDSFAHMQHALRSGEIDAMADNNLNSAAAEKVVADFDIRPFYFMAARERRDVLDPLNAAIQWLKRDTPDLETKLQAKYYGDSLAVQQFRRTEKESMFIWHCPKLKVACCTDIPAMEYFDTRTQGMRGSFIDILNALMSASGLNYELAPVSTMVESADLVREGKADLAVSVYPGVEVGAIYDLTFTKPYMYIHAMLIGKRGMEFDENKPLTVAISRQYVGRKFFIADEFPNWSVRIYEDIEACLDAVVNGEADLSLQGSNDVVPFFRSGRYDEIDSIPTLRADIPIAVGISTRMPRQLVEVLNKSITAVGEKEINSLIARNTINQPYEQSVYEFCRKNFGWIASAGLLLVLTVTGALLRLRRRRERELEQIAYKDRLTGIASVEKFERDVSEKLKEKGRAPYAMLYMDIEKFKFINESLGYERGNEVLRYYAKAFASQMREGELFARVSGDRFVALLFYNDNGGDSGELERRIEIFYDFFNNIRGTTLENHRLVIVTGIYLLRPDDMDVGTAMDRANLARKTIKGARGNAFAFYDEKIHRRVMKEKEIERVMEKALLGREFVVYFQPKFQIADRCIAGAEALVRWRMPNGSIAMPGDFIPVFERNGFIIELDFYVFEEVCRMQREWLREGKSIVPIAVNFSRLHVLEPAFLRRLQKTVQRYDIDPEYIEIEVTESVFVENDRTTADMILGLKALGFSLVMDDFGTGYSSLNLLREMPFDILKLDKSFLMHQEATIRERILISNIIRMAKELDIKVVAEGVETNEQLAFLTEVSCDVAQGYLFARPMPRREFEKVMWSEKS